MPERRGGVRRDAALSSLGMLLGGGAQFVVSVAVGHVLGPAVLGVLRGSLSLGNTASLLWPSAAGQSASLFVARESAAGRSEVAAGVARHLVGRVGLALVVLAPATAGAALLLLPVTVADALWVAALVIALGAYQIARGLRFGRGEVTAATLWEGVNAVATVGLLGVVLLLRQPGWLLAPLVVGNGLYAVAALGRPGPPTVAPTAELRRELDGFVAWGVAGTVASTGLMQVSMVVAAAVEPGSAAAGWYAAAVSLATPLSMVARALSMALFPELARLRGRDDRAAARALTDRATKGLAWLLVPAFTCLVVLSRPLTLLVFGASFEGAVVPLRVLLLAVLWATLPVAATNSLNVRGRAGVRLSALLAWLGFGVGLVAILALWALWGIVGVAAGYLVGVSTTAVAAFVVVWRRDAHGWGGVAAAALVPVVAFATVSGTTTLDSWGPSLVATLFVLVGTGLARWLAVARPPR